MSHLPSAGNVGKDCHNAFIRSHVQNVLCISVNVIHAKLYDIIHVLEIYVTRDT